MKDFTIEKYFINDGDDEVLIIKIEQVLKKNQWKNRYLLFNSETATYKNERKKQQWQNKQRQNKQSN